MPPLDENARQFWHDLGKHEKDLQIVPALTPRMEELTHDERAEARHLYIAGRGNNDFMEVTPPMYDLRPKRPRRLIKLVRLTNTSVIFDIETRKRITAIRTARPDLRSVSDVVKEAIKRMAIELTNK